MESNIDSGAPAPPPSKPPAPAISGHEILAMDSNGLERHLHELLRHGKPRLHLEEPAEDGSPQMASLVGVWLISQVGHAVDQKKLVSLSKVEDKKDLRSLKGVARLVSGALAGLREAQKAS